MHVFPPSLHIITLLLSSKTIPPLYSHHHFHFFSFTHFIKHLLLSQFSHSHISSNTFSSLKMANLTKLTKLKSAIKRWPSLTKLTRSSSSVSSSSNHQQPLHAVYVGKSRRRYLVNSGVVQHPVFQELVDRSCCEDGVVVVSCEVVLFEHLLWMLESGGNETQLGSMDELVEFYNCGAC